MTDPLSEHGFTEQEQGISAVRVVAEAVMTFFNELTANGATPEQALLLTTAWMTAGLGDKRDK